MLKKRDLIINLGMRITSLIYLTGYFNLFVDYQ